MGEVTSQKWPDLRFMKAKDRGHMIGHARYLPSRDLGSTRKCTGILVFLCFLRSCLKQYGEKYSAALPS